MITCYYNQNDYSHVPYEYKEGDGRTVKSSGCGVCAASMIVEGLLGVTFPPPEMAIFSQSCGARNQNGTRMQTLSRALVGKYPNLSVEETDKESALLDHLKRGGAAVALVYGSREGWPGAFSTAGHFIVVRGVSRDGRLEVLDPNLYSGKFSSAFRCSRITLEGNVALCSMETLQQDCLWCSPRYWLFSEEKIETEGENEMTKETFMQWFLEAVELYQQQVRSQEPSAWAKEAWDQACALGILDGSKPTAPLTREQYSLTLQRLGLLSQEKECE